jgi:hypothetical protein
MKITKKTRTGNKGVMDDFGTRVFCWDLKYWAKYLTNDYRNTGYRRGNMEFQERAYM